MSRDLVRVRKTPCSKLSLLDWYYLELEKFMTDIRLEANRVRLSSWMTPLQSNLRYLVGRLHGFGFGWSSMLIHSHCGDEPYDVFSGYMQEADFLCEAYQPFYRSQE